MKRISSCGMIGLLGGLHLLANNLQITNFSVNQANQTVSFRVSWENAWRLTSPPANWDAVWVFVKFRACNEFTQPWTHGVISTTLADHTIPAALEAVLSDGSGVGIDAAPNNLGIMLRPANAGTYATFGPHDVTLRITNLPTTGQYDFRIFGIEMVFIPEGAYTLGTLDGTTTSSTGGAYAFEQNGGGSPRVPYNITSEDPLTLRWNGDGGSGISVPASFPKGYKAFHVMKYEISQGQYAAFLNTLPGGTASLRYVGSFGTNRNRLASNGSYPNQYYSDREDRAQNFLSWHDLCAYLDWAALRPITEMEYEKICRGPLAEVRGEYAWGSTNITFGTTLSLTPENGTEIFSAPATANATGWIGGNYTGGDGGQGPVRVGIHAKPGSPSREASGASYYGVMDMSGNLWELVVMVSSPTGTVGAPAYQGTWGDGSLDWTTGLANQPDWPIGGANAGFGGRGGSWSDGIESHRVSARFFSRPGHTGWSTRNPTTRDNSTGGRGAR